MNIVPLSCRAVPLSCRAWHGRGLLIDARRGGLCTNLRGLPIENAKRGFLPRVSDVWTPVPGYLSVLDLGQPGIVVPVGHVPQ